MRISYFSKTHSHLLKHTDVVDVLSRHCGGGSGGDDGGGATLCHVFMVSR